MVIPCHSNVSFSTARSSQRELALELLRSAVMNFPVFEAFLMWRCSFWLSGKSFSLDMTESQSSYSEKKHFCVS